MTLAEAAAVAAQTSAQADVDYAEPDCGTNYP